MATELPTAEPRIRTILDAYLEVARHHTGRDDFVPGPKTKRTLYPAARDLAGELGAYQIPEREWGKFMWFAYKQMQARELTFVTPRSVCFLVPEYRKRPDDRSKYLRGL
jgi:hypothetical protein